MVSGLAWYGVGGERLPCSLSRRYARVVGSEYNLKNCTFQHVICLARIITYFCCIATKQCLLEQTQLRFV